MSGHLRVFQQCSIEQQNMLYIILGLGNMCMYSLCFLDNERSCTETGWRTWFSKFLPGNQDCCIDNMSSSYQWVLFACDYIIMYTISQIIIVCQELYSNMYVITKAQHWLHTLQMDIKGGVTNFRRRILSIDINQITDRYIYCTCAWPFSMQC